MDGDNNSKTKPSVVKIHNFSHVICDKNVYFHILSFGSSFLLWIGTSPQLKSLAMAMKTPYVSTNAQFSCLCISIFF